MTMLGQLGPWSKTGVIVLASAGAVGLIILIIKAAQEAKRKAKERLDAMVVFAHSNGLRFEPGPDGNHDEEYNHFEVFQRGFARSAYNTISGTLELRGAFEGLTAQVKTGDFTYKTRETHTTRDSNGRTRTRTRIVTHHFSYFILGIPLREMPGLLIRREGIFDKIASAFGSNDIDFESAEFSRKYYVKSKSRKFAYDIVNQRMIEFLLATRPGVIDIEFGRVSLTDGMTLWSADRFAESLGWTLEFLEHWPGFVVEDLREGRQV